MKIEMLVSVSRSDGFHAAQGQTLDVDAALSAEMIEQGWAVAVERQPSSVVSRQSSVVSQPSSVNRDSRPTSNIKHPTSNF